MQKAIPSSTCYYGKVQMSASRVSQARYVSMTTDPATSFSFPHARFNQNALHFATSKGNLSTVRTLLANKCSARVKDRRGQLPLHRAAAIGSIPIIKLLLEEGKSPVNATDIDGLTALHHAISEGHGDAAITLLKAGAEADKKDSEGCLAIETAPDAKVSCPRFSWLMYKRADCRSLLG